MIVPTKGRDMSGTEHHKALPDDLLHFLDVTDEFGEPPPERCVEELAVNTVPDSPRLPLDDPALREIGREERTSRTRWFDDEEPEGPLAYYDEDDEVEPVDELLEAQHYLFEEDDEDQ
jgi:hypothetical protein